MKKSWKHFVRDVVNGKRRSFKTNGVCPQMISDYMQSLGFKAGDFTTNGWQYDWWLPFTLNEGERGFTAHGSGYYGNFSFYRSES